jgi:hypothetical protein
MTRTFLRNAAVSVVLAALPAVAQQIPIVFQPPACVRAAEMPILKLDVNEPGELRCYFRRSNATDWCSVRGENNGALSRVTLPKFDSGDEIEYFFILLDGKRVIARSPKIFRVRVTEGCDNAWARNVAILPLDCGDNGSGSIPSSLGAGYAVGNSLVESTPPFASFDRPGSPSTTAAGRQ